MLCCSLFVTMRQPLLLLLLLLLLPLLPMQALIYKCFYFSKVCNPGARHRCSSPSWINRAWLFGLERLLAAKSLLSAISFVKLWVWRLMRNALLVRCLLPLLYISKHERSFPELLKLGNEKLALKFAKHLVSSLDFTTVSLHPRPDFAHTLWIHSYCYCPPSFLTIFQLGGHSRGKAKRNQMASVLQKLSKQKMTKH